MSPNQWVNIGDLVSVERWDKSERPGNQLGSPARVAAIATGQFSETGVMVTVVGTSWRSRTLDMNWLAPLKRKEG